MRPNIETIRVVPVERNYLLLYKQQDGVLYFPRLMPFPQRPARSSVADTWPLSYTWLLFYSPDIRAAVMHKTNSASVTGIAWKMGLQADHVQCVVHGEPHRNREPDTVPTYNMSCGLSVPCGSAYSHKAISVIGATLVQ